MLNINLFPQVSFYKDMLKTDRRFQAFVRQKSTHPLMKKKGIPQVLKKAKLY